MAQLLLLGSRTELSVIIRLLPNPATSLTTMAKKPVPEGRKRTQKKNSPEESNKTTKKVSKSQNKNNTKAKNSTSIITKTKGKTKDEKNNKIRKSVKDDRSSEETEDLVAPSSSIELVNHDVVESDEEEVARGCSSEEEKEEDKETLINIKRKGKKDVVKNKGKKRSREEEDESEAEDTGENSLYTFPMNRISRIIKSENPDIKILKEAVFVINRASEKFLQAFCREAYAHAFLENKKHTAYEHLSTIVSRRKRLNFLADFIPEKVKAEDAVAQLAEAKQ